MDNNPNTQASINTSPAPQAAPVQPVTNVVQEPPSGGNKKMLWAILGLVVLILIVGGIYWYLGQGRGTSTPAKATPKPTAATSVDTLEKDLNSTSLDDLDKEFSSVDTDLQGL
ncbi:MAG: hypothetical protein AAB414_01075 [Patescibacteria group bacterium]